MDFILIRRLRAIAQLIVFSMMEGNFKLNRCVCACLRACVCVCLRVCLRVCLPVCVCVCTDVCDYLCTYFFYTIFVLK